MHLTIHLGDALEEGQAILRLPRISHDDFQEFCQRNPDLKVELNTAGELVLMAPTGGETGNRNIKILRYLDEWSDENGTGLAFDSSTMFVLPSGAERSPDAAWVRRERWEELTPQQRESFVPLCPDFIVELLSPSNRLADTQRKMEEYIANGAQLGWLIDRRTRTVYVYRPQQSAQILNDPAVVSGDPELPGFSLRMERIF
jgi:Uma2 family endonuclease